MQEIRDPPTKDSPPANAHFSIKRDGRQRKEPSLPLAGPTKDLTKGSYSLRRCDTLYEPIFRKVPREGKTTVSGKLVEEQFTETTSACPRRTGVRQRVTRGVAELVQHCLPTSTRHDMLRIKYKANLFAHSCLRSIGPKRLYLGSVYPRITNYFGSLLNSQVHFFTKSTRHLGFPTKRDLVTSYSTLR